LDISIDFITEFFNSFRPREWNFAITVKGNT